MRILTFSAYYTPEIVSSMYLTEDIYKALVSNGHEIMLFCPIPCRGVSKETRKKYKKLRKEEKYDGKLHIRRFFLFKEHKSTFLRFIRYYFLTWIFFFKGLFVKADVIFAQSTPPIIGLALSKLRFWKRIPVVYNLQDIFPDSLVNAGITKKGSLIWKIGRCIEKKTYKSAKHIIVISEDFENNIITKGISKNKITLIPNWVDGDEVLYVEREKNKLFDLYNLDRHKFYVAYSGNIGYTQDLDMLLDAALILQSKNKEVGFILVGEGAAKEHVLKRISDEKINNVAMIPFQDYRDISFVFSLGDVGLIISKKGIGENSVPSKTWSYMAASRPILASFDLNSQLSLTIKKAGCGLISEAGNIDDFVEKVLWFSSHRDSLEKMGRSGREFVVTELDKKRCSDLYCRTIENATKKE